MYFVLLILVSSPLTILVNSTLLILVVIVLSCRATSFELSKVRQKS